LRSHSAPGDADVWDSGAEAPLGSREIRRQGGKRK
jgi:hypothetical protein